MSTSYALLLGLVIFLILFIYFVFFSVSLRLEKNENEAEIAVKRKAVPFRWKDLVVSKNKKLSWIDLGNHILVVGVILFAIFIITNA
jgi:sensor domain CHASE-containing protein